MTGYTFEDRVAERPGTAMLIGLVAADVRPDRRYWWRVTLPDCRGRRPVLKRCGGCWSAPPPAVRAISASLGAFRYQSRPFANALGATEHRRTRPYRPQTNGKLERGPAPKARLSCCG